MFRRETCTLIDLNFISVFISLLPAFFQFVIQLMYFILGLIFWYIGKTKAKLKKGKLQLASNNRDLARERGFSVQTLKITECPDPFAMLVVNQPPTKASPEAFINISLNSSVPTLTSLCKVSLKFTKRRIGNNVLKRYTKVINIKLIDNKFFRSKYNKDKIKITSKQF
ncbi:hypothetical protein VNO77_11013 [Canavalia gladiata]|uniref:Uncharacterized protein n=1 Tax=Canavalia gladiata TaxID=3824 RepID=A0AAN9QY49_CANGL